MVWERLGVGKNGLEGVIGDAVGRVEDADRNGNGNQVDGGGREEKKVTGDQVGREYRREAGWKGWGRFGESGYLCGGSRDWERRCSEGGRGRIPVSGLVFAR